MGEQPPRTPLSARAFADILLSTQSTVLAFVRQLVGNNEDAHDVVQDVYIQAWRIAQAGDPPFVYARTASGAELDAAGIRRWLFRVAYRQAISLLRHRSLIPWQSLDGEDEEQVVAVAAIGHRVAEPFEDQIVEGVVLEAAFSRLQRSDVACLLLDIVQGFSTAEIAQIIGIAPDAARKRLSRAMERLRAAYFAHETQPTPTRKGGAK